MICSKGTPFFFKFFPGGFKEKSLPDFAFEHCFLVFLFFSETEIYLTMKMSNAQKQSMLITFRIKECLLSNAVPDKCLMIACNIQQPLVHTLCVQVCKEHTQSLHLVSILINYNNCKSR